MGDWVVGAHVPSSRPLHEAARRAADAIQLFLSPPQSFKKPLPRGDADELIASPIPLYVHAPYLINVGSGNNRVRIPSRKIMADTIEAAAAVGAMAVIVHGGHVDDDDRFEVAVERWRKALDSVELTLPILIENTAGGGNAIARTIDSYGPLWEGIGDYNVGVCLDTCHAWSAGEDLESVVERLLAATGRIDLVHCNDSRDPLGSGRDRHTNLGRGEIPEELMVGVARQAGAPVIVETPGDSEGQAADIEWLRRRL